ncbi:peptidoglycan-binding protein [Psychromonas sp. B3M02]|uniref:LysM peptidoglycan-binding domain-containing protein n=1 Tax=Psychromonas sp. B3M02 TaxID=2267226 RepID=UPI000DE96864|nr:LysM domain-containing protein [Psychromonas sp. B3M02]RBW44006.1 peptidoglycan-binding protein [Psychromonas sp. B3M02]
MKLKLIASLLVGVVLSITAFADTLKLRADHPETYIVKKGDTLWDISALFLNSPWLWPRLWENNSQIANPHLIYPGDVLNLIWVDGEPRLTRKRLKKLSPTPRIQEKDQAIPIIPLNRLSAFLTKDHIISPDLLEGTPKVLGDAVGSPRFFEGDIFYGQGQFDENKLYGIYRLGENFKGKYSENLGSELLFIGQAQVSKSPNVDTTAEATPLDLLRSSREARQGDLILPIPEYESLPAYFIPKPVSKSVKGQILSSLNGPSAIGKWDVVVIDKGKMDGIQIGSMFSILRSGQAILVNDDVIYQEDGDAFDQIGDPDITLPAERVGELMVFKVYENLSIAILMRGKDVIGSTYKIEGLSF